MENLFQKLENSLTKLGYIKKHFGGVGIYPYVLVNYNTNISVGIKNDGTFYVAPNSPNHYEFKTIKEVIEYIS